MLVHITRCHWHSYLSRAWLQVFTRPHSDRRQDTCGPSMRPKATSNSQQRRCTLHLLLPAKQPGLGSVPHHGTEGISHHPKRKSANAARVLVSCHKGIRSARETATYQRQLTREPATRKQNQPPAINTRSRQPKGDSHTQPTRGISPQPRNHEPVR